MTQELWIALFAMLGGGVGVEIIRRAAKPGETMVKQHEKIREEMRTDLAKVQAALTEEREKREAMDREYSKLFTQYSVLKSEHEALKEQFEQFKLDCADAMKSRRGRKNGD